MFTEIADKNLLSRIGKGGYVGIAQLNPIIGDLEGNSRKISDCIKYAEQLKLDLVVVPLSALMGFPLGNILERHPFLADEALKWIEGLSKLTQNTTAIIGFFNNDGIPAAAVLHNGKTDKILKTNGTYLLNEKMYGINISGDLQSSSVELRNSGADAIINFSLLPFRAGEEPVVENSLSYIAKSQQIPVLSVNQVGANDNTSFIGASIGVNKEGKLFARAKSFEEDFLIINPFKSEGTIFPLPYKSENKTNDNFTLDYESDLERTYKTLIQGIKDYFNKCGLKRAVLGLSGGLDSTVCAVLLADALGKENVFGISMPSKLTSNESKSDAKELAQNLGINFAELSIKPVVETTTDCLNQLFREIENTWTDRYEKSYTPDNIQARTRAVYLWGISNEFPSCIPIATSDKSEAYMGYATINGDMSGGYAPIADVTKTKLFALARWLNKNRTEKNVIPESVILKKPGAELAINPNTGKTLNAEDALMPYEFLDEIIWRIENKKERYSDLVNTEFVYEREHKVSEEQKLEWLDKFYGRMSKALYKWSIMPPSLIVDTHSINKSEYVQPITSGKINYKGNTPEAISLFLCQ